MEYPLSSGPSLIEVRDSPQHGRGVFACGMMIPAETRILPFLGPHLRLAELDQSAYHLQVGDDEYLGPSGQPDDYVNHSCTPNCALDVDLQLYALWDIPAGTELTWDYSTAIDEADFAGFPCSCGTVGCRQTVHSYRHLEVSVQVQLWPLLLPYLRRKYAAAG